MDVANVIVICVWFLQDRKTMTGYDLWVIPRQTCSLSVSLSCPPHHLKMSKKRQVWLVPFLNIILTQVVMFKKMTLQFISYLGIEKVFDCTRFHIIWDHQWPVCNYVIIIIYFLTQCCTCFSSSQCVTTCVNNHIFFLSVGSRDHPPLSKDPIPASWNADWLAGWSLHYRKAGQEQAEAHHSGNSREAGERSQGCEICGMLRPHTGNKIIHQYIPVHMSILWLTCDTYLTDMSEERGTCLYSPWPCCGWSALMTTLVKFLLQVNSGHKISTRS